MHVPCNRFYHVQRCLESGKFPIHRAGVAAVAVGTASLTVASLALLFLCDHPAVSMQHLVRTATRPSAPAPVTKDPHHVPAAGSC